MLLVYWQFHAQIASIVETSSSGTTGGLIILTMNIVSVVLLLFWGGYIMLMAMSISTSTKRSQFDHLLNTLKDSGRTLFWFGSLVTFCYAVLLVVSISVLDVLQMTTVPGWFQTAAIGLLTAIVMALILRWLAKSE